MTEGGSSKNRRVLVIGGPGSGKTYVSQELRMHGYNTVDADSIEGLSRWVNMEGEEVEFPELANRRWLKTHRFILDRSTLKDFLVKNPSLYLFGVSHNIFEIMDLFDRTYYLDLDPRLVRKRMMGKERLNPLGKTDQQQQEVIEVIRELREKAESLGLRFIDSSLSPKEILEMMS